MMWRARPHRTRTAVSSKLARRFIERLKRGEMVDRTAKQKSWGTLRTVAAPEAMKPFVRDA